MVPNDFYLLHSVSECSDLLVPKGRSDGMSHSKLDHQKPVYSSGWDAFILCYTACTAGS